MNSTARRFRFYICFTATFSPVIGLLSGKMIYELMFSQPCLVSFEDHCDIGARVELELKIGLPCCRRCHELEQLQKKQKKQLLCDHTIDQDFITVVTDYYSSKNNNNNMCLTETTNNLKCSSGSD